MKKLILSLLFIAQSPSAFAIGLKCEASSNNKISVKLSDEPIHLTTFDSKEEVLAVLDDQTIYIFLKSPDGSTRSIEMTGETFAYAWIPDINNQTVGGLAQNQYIQCIKTK